MAVKYWDIISKNIKKSDKKNKKKNNGYDVVILQPPRSFNTGAGPDGVVQPNRPAMIDMTNGQMRVLHEDENVTPNGNGMDVQPSPQTYVPKSEQEQAQIAQMEKQNPDIKGYQFGGGYQYRKPGQTALQPTAPITASGPANPDTANRNVTLDPGGMGRGTSTPARDPIIPVGTRPQGANIPTPDPGRTVTDPLAGRTQTPQDANVAPITPNQQSGVRLPTPITPQPTDINVPDISQPQQTGVRIPTPITPQEPTDINIPDIQGQRQPIQPDTQETDPINIAPIEIQDAQPEEQDAWKEEYLKQLEALLRSGMDSFQASTAAAQKASAQRRAASPYLTEGAKLAMEAEAQRSAGLAGSDLAAKMAEQYNQGILTAEEHQLRRDEFDENQRQWDENFAFLKEKYGDQEGQRILNDVELGWDAFHDLHPDILESDYNNMRRLLEQRVDLGDLTNTAQRISNVAAELGLESQETRQLAEMINSGMEYDQIIANDRYKDLTPSQYLSMLDATAFGQVGWDRKTIAIDTLLKNPTAENIARAEELFGKIFGESVDFSGVLDDANIADFNVGWNALNGYISEGKSWDEAMALMKADPSMGVMFENMSDRDIQRAYESSVLQNDPLYSVVQQADRMLEKGIINQDQYDDYVAVVMDAVYNPEGYVVEDGFAVLDELGNEVGFYTDRAEADQYVADNPNTEVGPKIRDHVRKKDIGIGDTPDDPDNPDLTPKQAYESWLEKYAPKEFQDITQSEWEAAGKPKTWEEYKENTPDQGVAIYEKYGFTSDLLDDDGKFLMNDDELSAIVDSIKDGNSYTKNKFFLDPDDGEHEIYNVVSNQESGKPVGTHEEVEKAVNEAKGKIIQDPNGHYVTIMDVEKTSDKWGTHFRMKIKDFETGEIRHWTISSST